MDVYDWFKDYFQKNGKAECREVIRAAKAAGFTKSEIKDAKSTLQIESTSVIFWSLPEERV